MAINMRKVKYNFLYFIISSSFYLKLHFERETGRLIRTEHIFKEILVPLVDGMAFLEIIGVRCQPIWHAPLFFFLAHPSILPIISVVLDQS